ncbi:unnamed protein product [Ectocarpus sp. 4 AP-2014]
MVVPSSVSWEDVEQGAKEVMKHKIWKTQTWKEFKTTIAAAIHVPVKELTQHKVALQALIAQEGEEGANGNEDDHPEEGVDDEDGDEDDRNEGGSSSSDDNDQGDAMPAMRDLARAMNLGSDDCLCVDSLLSISNTPPIDNMSTSQDYVRSILKRGKENTPSEIDPGRKKTKKGTDHGTLLLQLSYSLQVHNQPLPICLL